MKCTSTTLAMVLLAVAADGAPAAENGSAASVSANAVVATASPSRGEPDGHYPLDQSGGIAVSSADLEAYLAALRERAAARAFLLMFRDLLFAPQSARIDTHVQGELARMAEFLRAHPDTTAQIIGYADDRVEILSNAELAEQRATAVRSYLIGLGVDGDRLLAVGRREMSPTADNRTGEGRDNNRRVQVFVHKRATQAR